MLFAKDAQSKRGILDAEGLGKIRQKNAALVGG